MSVLKGFDFDSIPQGSNSRINWEAYRDGEVHVMVQAEGYLHDKTYYQKYFGAQVNKTIKDKKWEGHCFERTKDGSEKGDLGKTLTGVKNGTEYVIFRIKSAQAVPAKPKAASAGNRAARRAAAKAAEVNATASPVAEPTTSA